MTAKRSTPRTRIEDLRRKELIEAAHRVFMLHGLGGMTTKRICAAAEMSPGILSYYFKGKADVVFAVVRLNNRLLVKEVVRGLNCATSRWERLEAIVSGNFPTDLFKPNVANAWLSVCAASATDAHYSRLQRVFYARLHSNLASVFSDVLLERQFEKMALSLGAMIDGLWLRRATGEAITSEGAVALVLCVTSAMLTERERMQIQAPDDLRI